jgi:acetylornithine deacetylase/succinyl-diaminopimelate desuccinylase family protein
MKPLHQTLQDLVRINSVNAFYQGGVGEAEISRYVQTFFEARGISTLRQPVLPAQHGIEPRENVIACLPGRNRSRRLVLEAHMDTVSIDGMSLPPFDATIREHRLFGRGACDTKAGLAAMMHAVADASTHHRPPACDIWLAAVVDEEFSFRGVAKFCEEYRADAAIVAEPTENRLVISSKGVLRWKMISHGKSAHSSKCYLGINAIANMARVVLALEQDHERLSKTSYPLLGPASCNVGKIHGGVQVNFVPDRCEIEIDRRLLPNESVAQVLEHYSTLLSELKRSTEHFDVQMDEPMLVDEAWAVDPNCGIVQTAIQVLRELNLDSEPTGVPFGSDASKFGRAGIPCILFGPGSIDQAHSAVEYVELDQVDVAYEFYRKAIESFE